MASPITASHRVVTAPTAEVSSVSKPGGGIACAVKHCCNSPAQLSSLEPIQEGRSPLKRSGAFRGGERPGVTRKPNGLFAAHVKRCHNDKAQPLSQKGLHHYLQDLVRNIKGLKAGLTSSKEVKISPMAKAPEPITAAKREEIKESVKLELIKLDLAGTILKEDKFKDQAFRSNCAAIFSQAKDRVGSECLKRQVTSEFRRECFRELGDVARNFGMEGAEEGGVFTPAGIGANIFVTAIMSAVANSHQKEFSNNGFRTEMSQYIGQRVGEQLRELAIEHGRPDPQALSSALADVEVMWFPAYDEKLVF